MSTPKARILAIDDTPANLITVGAALDDEFDIQIATSGRSGLALAEQAPPDLILLDVMMPEMDGLEALRRLRATPWGRKIPVILVTADNRVETQLEGLGLGADDFMAKPMEIPVLRARARNILARCRLEREQAELAARLEAANQELARLSELNALLLSSAGAGIFSTDLQGRCTSVNPAVTKLLGFTEAELLGQDQHLVLHRIHPDGTPYPLEDCPISKTLRDGQVRSCEEHFMCKSGAMLPVHLTVTPMLKGDVQIGAEVVFEDISERQRMERELVLLATTDSLTGVLNRRRFFELGEVERMRVFRYGGPSAVLMLDLDHFKRINDRYGHSTGDEVLRQFAQAVGSLLRTIDVFGRVGGEEFAILLPGTDLRGAAATAERLREQVAAIRLGGKAGEVKVTVSIGVTDMRASDPSLDAVLGRADRALYDAKAAGRNRVSSVVLA